MIPQLEEICREAMRVDKLGDDLDGTIGGGDVSEATTDVCRNDDVVTLIRKTLPEIEHLVVMKATDDDGWDSSLLEDAIGTLVSNFLIAAARIYSAPRETRREKRAATITPATRTSLEISTFFHHLQRNFCCGTRMENQPPSIPRTKRALRRLMMPLKR
jgi:hypothetical protein